MEQQRMQQRAPKATESLRVRKGVWTSWSLLPVATHLSGLAAQSVVLSSFSRRSRSGPRRGGGTS
eukprot:9901125-Alexandrium_andersonii.AAC.1